MHVLVWRDKREFAVIAVSWDLERLKSHLEWAKTQFEGGIYEIVQSVTILQ